MLIFVYWLKIYLLLPTGYLLNNLVCLLFWVERELGWALGEGGGRMEINSIFRNEKGGKNRDRVKQLRDLRTHAFNLRALTVQAGQATNDARVLEGEIFPPHEDMRVSWVLRA